MSHTTLAQCPRLGPALRAAVASEVQYAAEHRASVVEPGGWVLDTSLRRSTEGARLALGVWAWSRLMGGTVGLATATLRNHSSEMLCRIGGSPMRSGETIFEKYFEPKYGCDIQLLRFDSWRFAPRYRRVIDSLCEELALSPVISASAAPAWMSAGPMSAAHQRLARAAHAAA